MSKIYSDQVRKAQMLAAGLKKNFSTVSSHGITEKMIHDLEESAKAVDGLNKEIEALREEVGHKVRLINNHVEEMKRAIRQGKLAIKRDFEQEEWQRFGIADKR
jgi:hypothetical protein